MNWKSSENLVIDEIFKDISILANSLGVFLSTAFSSLEEHLYGQDTLVLKQVHREKLGLAPNQKPGDIDLLLVPFNGSPMLEKSIAIEVKVVRPTLEKPGKNASKLGISQASGLMRDGFPFVGLLHICIPENSPTEMHLQIPMKGWKVDESGNMEDLGYRVPLDPFPLMSAYRQLGRILAKEAEEAIAYRVIGLTTNPEDESIAGCTIGQQRVGLKNPKLNHSLLQKIDGYLSLYPDEVRHITWNQEI